MSKRLFFVSVLSLIMFFSSFQVVDASYGIDFSLIKQIDDTKTFEKEQVIYGKSNPGTVIELCLYYLDNDIDTIVSNKNIVSKEIDKDKWVLCDSDEWTVGASGVFMKTVCLKYGKNKIVLNIKDESGNIEQREYEVELVDRKRLSESISEIILKSFERSFNIK